MSHLRLYRLPGLSALVLGVAGLLAMGGCGKLPPPLAPPEAPTVTVKTPQVREYTPTKEFTGRLVTKDPVKVLPQVTGMVLHRAFIEGAEVEKDKTLLF